MRALGDWSLFWHPQWLECVSGRSDHSEEEENLLTSLPTFQGLPFISTTMPCGRARVINVPPPLVGTKLEGLLPLASLVCAENFSEFGYTRYLHSHSEADDTAKECCGGLVLRLRTCCFFSLQYSRICIPVMWLVHASGI